jgi:DNA polymerase III epsilon subunit-like protein
LGRYDEILQLALVDATGCVLFYDSFKPTEKKSWPQAQRVHSIAPRDVKGKAPFQSRRAEIQGIIDAGALIVAYNAEFDLGFLSAQGIKLQEKPYLCLMKEFACVYGRKKVHGHAYTYQSLEVCAQYYGVQNPEAHNALADAQTTLYCYQAFMQEGKYRPRREKWSMP